MVVVVVMVVVEVFVEVVVMVVVEVVVEVVVVLLDTVLNLFVFAQSFSRCCAKSNSEESLGSDSVAFPREVPGIARPGSPLAKHGFGLRLRLHGGHSLNLNNSI